MLVNTTTEPVSAAVTAVVSAAGTISSQILLLVVLDIQVLQLLRSLLLRQSVLVLEQLPRVQLLVNGSINSTTITNAGFGYTRTAPPQVLVSSPALSVEKLTGITAVAGFAATPPVLPQQLELVETLLPLRSVSQHLALQDFKKVIQSSSRILVLEMVLDL